MHQDYEDLHKEPQKSDDLQQADLALRHCIYDAKLGLGGTKREVAYRMAENAHALYKLGGDLSKIEWEIRFDIAEFVFNHTHYDECSNWWFFRRS